MSDSLPPAGPPREPGPPQAGEPAGPAQPQPRYGQPPSGYGQPPPAPADPATTPYRQVPPEYAATYGQPPQREYPRQELLPQEVRPGRSRVPLVIGLVAALALIGGGVVAYLLLRDNGESTRAQYCSAIRHAARGGDITSSLQGGQQAAVAEVRKIAGLAPDAVSGDWKTLSDFVASAQKSQSNVNLGAALSAFSALKSIIADSNSHCHTTFPTPSLP